MKDEKKRLVEGIIEINILALIISILTYLALDLFAALIILAVSVVAIPLFVHIMEK